MSAGPGGASGASGATRWDAGRGEVATRVLRSDDPSLPGLLGAGWRVTEESWGAQLTLDAQRVVDLAALADVTGVAAPVRFVRLGAGDVGQILALDAATAGDYPGGLATRHARLDPADAVPGARRLFFGARAQGVPGAGVPGAGVPGARVQGAGDLVAMTVVDLGVEGEAEIDFTVVASSWRGCGVATALKAWSLVALADLGVDRVRTGGSARNTAIVAANARLGFVVDERWLTLTDEGVGEEEGEGAPD